jgi:hypothetical protein
MKRRVGSQEPGHDSGALLEDDDPLKQAPAARPRRTGRRVWPRVLFVFAALLLLLAGLLPRILSLAPFRNMLLAKVNAALAPATLSVDDWSLRWFGGMSVSGLKFTDAAHHADVQALKINTSGGLFGMLPIGKLNLGTITVDTPQVSLSLPAKNAAGETPPAEPVAPAAAKPASLPVADLAVKLIVEGGRIEVTGAGATPFVLEHVSLATDVKSMHDPVALKLAAFVPWKDDAGVLSIEGSVPRPAYFLTGGAPSQERLKFGVKQLDLQGFRALLESLTGQPWIRSGIADGVILLTYRGREAVQMKTDLAVANLSIEPPGKTNSPAGDVRVRADLDYADGQLKIGEFSCASPWASLLADGQFAVLPAANGRRIGGIGAKAEIDLQALTRDFGSLLNLRDDFCVEHGRMRVDAVLAGTPDALEAKVSLVTSNLALRSGSELFDLQPAPTAKVNVVKPYGQPFEVRELQIDIPFAHVTGKGRIDNATVKVGLDLEAFTKDFRRVLTSCPSLTGALDAELKTSSENDRMALEFAATATGVRAELQPGRALTLHKGTLKVSGRAPLVNGLPLADVSDVHLSFDSEAGSITGSAARIVPGGSNQPPVIVDGQFKAELDLAAARSFAGPFIPQLPTNAVLGGKLASAISAGMAGGQAKVRVNAVLQDARLLTTAWDVREDDVRLRMCVDSDLSNGTIKVFDTHLVSRLATVDIADWQVQLPRGDQALSIKGDAKGEVDIAVLSGWQRAGKSGPPPQMEGKLTFQAHGVSERQNVSVTLGAALDSFRLAAANAAPFVEPHAEITLKASLPDDAKRLTVEVLSLKSSLADVDTKGTVEDATTRPLANLSGNVGVDFGNVNKLLRARGLQYPVVAGHKLRPFAVSGPVDFGAASIVAPILAYGKAHAALYLDSASAFGVTAGPADLGATLAGGILKVDYQPALNQGKLLFTPSVEVTRAPMLLSFPPQARVLQNVQLTQEMLDQGLTLLLPLLHGCSVLGGTVDLTLQECHVPLGATLTNDMTFSSALTLHNLRLSPTGTLGAILELAGHSGQEITVAQYDLTAECSHGRVKPSDLVLNAGGSKITLSGSVDLNGALAYTAVVPLSRGLVSEKLAKYLEGETIRVPITGTIGSPAIDRKAVDAEVKRLVRDAAKKAASVALGGLLNELKR